MDQHDDTAQIELDLGSHQTAGDVLARIRAESRENSEKGRWFEQLFMQLARREPEFEIADIHRWPDWPDRRRLTGLDGRDISIDLVAERTDGDLIAVQAKCYDDKHVIIPAGCMTISLVEQRRRRIPQLCMGRILESANHRSGRWRSEKSQLTVEPPNSVRGRVVVDPKVLSDRVERRATSAHLGRLGSDPLVHRGLGRIPQLKGEDVVEQGSKALRTRPIL